MQCPMHCFQALGLGLRAVCEGSGLAMLLHMWVWSELVGLAGPMPIA